MNPKFALIIGTSEYDDASISQLNAPVQDVDGFVKVLQSPDIGGFDMVNTCINDPYTQVQEAIADFFAEKKRDDLLLMYFSGHGILDEQGRLYLAVKNTRRNRLSVSAISAAFIMDEMDRCRSNRQVLILDCCYSGAFTHGTKGEAKAITKNTFEGNGFGRVVLTATNATQYAWEGDKIIGQAENSVFTHYLIQGLQTGAADQDNDGWISLDELYDYVQEQVVSTMREQKPSKWSYKQQGRLIIAKAFRENYQNFKVEDYNEFRVLFEDQQHIYAQTPNGSNLKSTIPIDSQLTWMIDRLGTSQAKGNINLTERHILGDALYKVLFGGEIGTAFKETLNKIQEHPNAQLRLVLASRPEVRELINLPWECTFIPETDGKLGNFITDLTEIVMSRHVLLSDQAPSKIWERRAEPLRILVVVSDLEEPIAAKVSPIIESIEEGYEPFDVEIYLLHQLDRPYTFEEDLWNCILVFVPHVLHFIGKNIFANEDQNTIQMVDTSTFSNLLYRVDRRPQLVFLHACEGTESTSYQAFRDIALDLVCSSAPVVVTFHSPIDTKGSIRFTREFYHCLIEGVPIDVAVHRGCIEMKSYLYEPDSFALVNPVVYFQSRNGSIFSGFPSAQRDTALPIALPKSRFSPTIGSGSEIKNERNLGD